MGSGTRCPIARHRTVSARPRTLLVYEGNESHVIKNMAATVKFFSPHKVSFSWISPPRGILLVGSYAYVCGPPLYGVALNDIVQFVPCDQISLLYPLLYGVALSDSVIIACQGPAAYCGCTLIMLPSFLPVNPTFERNNCTLQLPRKNL